MRYELTFQSTFRQKAGRLWFPLLLVIALLASAPVPAGEVHGTAVADQVQGRGAGSTSVLNGAGNEPVRAAACCRGAHDCTTGVT